MKLSNYNHFEGEEPTVKKDYIDENKSTETRVRVDWLNEMHSNIYTFLIAPSPVPFFCSFSDEKKSGEEREKTVLKRKLAKSWIIYNVEEEIMPDNKNKSFVSFARQHGALLHKTPFISLFKRIFVVLDAK